MNLIHANDWWTSTEIFSWWILGWNVVFLVEKRALLWQSWFLVASLLGFGAVLKAVATQRWFLVAQHHPGDQDNVLLAPYKADLGASAVEQDNPFIPAHWLGISTLLPHLGTSGTEWVQFGTLRQNISDYLNPFPVSSERSGCCTNYIHQINILLHPKNSFFLDSNMSKNEERALRSKTLNF